MTAPPPRRTIAGTAACVARNIDFRSTAITRSHSSSVVSSRPLRDSMPTLLCRMSTPPQRSTAALTTAAHSAGRVTSAAWATASLPSARIAATVSSARSFTWSTQKTFAPSRAKRMAVALPLPRPGPREPAPVMIATLPFSRPLTGLSLQRARTGIAVPRKPRAIGAETGRDERLEDRAAAHGASVPGGDLEPAHRPLQERPLHEGLERGDHSRQIDLFPTRERREVTAVALGEKSRPALTEHEPVLGQARSRHARAVAPREGEDAAPEVRGVDHVDQHVGLGAARGSIEVAERVGQRVLLARQAGHEVAAHDLAAILHPSQGVPYVGPAPLAQPPAPDPVPCGRQLGAPS